MPEHDPTRTAYQRARAAEKAAHDDAVRVIEPWNAALAAGRHCSRSSGRRLTSSIG